MNAEGIARRIARNQCLIGEVRPGVDARTIEEALEVAREMARALALPDVEEGESLLDIERRLRLVGELRQVCRPQRCRR